jgi:hypothetical protein
MSKLDLFGKIFKKKDVKPNNNENNTENNEIKNNVILEHTEILYSSDTKKTKKIQNKKEIIKESDDIKWRDIEGIEKKIDKLSNNKLKDTSIDISLNKKVDNIITKKKKHRKPSNVIYVVSKPQPGQVKGDWAVRSHGKIFSHHRTKENAIKKAREIASKRDATVLIQNTDGTFSSGFKPRVKTK